jgi:hypothetical protein
MAILILNGVSRPVMRRSRQVILIPPGGMAPGCLLTMRATPPPEVFENGVGK